MIIFGYVVLAIFLGIIAWFWVASLITHACNQWWSSRETYRKKVGDEVAQMLDDNFQVH